MEDVVIVVVVVVVVLSCFLQTKKTANDKEIQSQSVIFCSRKLATHAK